MLSDVDDSVSEFRLGLQDVLYHVGGLIRDELGDLILSV